MKSVAVEKSTNGDRLQTFDRPLVTTRRPGARGTTERPEIAEQLVSLVAPASFEADQYRRLRHLAERLGKDEDFKVLAVTSPGPQDGKTITILNLAGSLAQSPRARILVVDADIRRPSVAKYLGLEPHESPGLAEIILDPACNLTEAVRRVEWANLSVLLPGRSAATTPYELLNSDRFEALMRDARRFYDFVLIDTPPMVPLPDCRLIARWVDGFFLVVAAHKTSRKLLAEALNQLDAKKIVGVVFNSDDQLSSAQYGYYGYFGAPSRTTHR